MGHENSLFSIVRLSTTLVLSTVVHLSVMCMYLLIATEAGIWPPCDMSSSRHPVYSMVNKLEQGYPRCGEDDDNVWPLYNIVNVDWYGAIGDGATDNTKAFAEAWKDACGSADSAVLIIPMNGTYLVNQLQFKGPCKSSLIVELAGTLIAPSELSIWNISKTNAWLHFSHINELIVGGGGTLDGQGEQWWEQSCKRNKTNKCQDAPTALRFSSVYNLRVRDLLSVNSPQIHVKFANCYAVQVVNLQVDAPADSPNTDGIHISGTQNFVIQDSVIGTGDDCISIVSGSSDIQIRNILCGPGHGISIGSLGKGGSEDYVSLVMVDGAIIAGTSHGLRIKTWAGGAGLAIGFRFENIQMINVSYPIIIDQKYRDSSSCSVNEASAVQVSQVCYRNIWGTSATKQAIKLTCSETAPCRDLFFENVTFVPETGKGNSTSLCANAQGIWKGTVIPPVDCLESSTQARDTLHFNM